MTVLLDEPESLDAQSARHVLRRTGTLLHPQLRAIVLASLVMLGSTACMLAGPWLVRYGIDHALPPRHDGRLLDVIAATYLAVAAGALYFGRRQIWMVARIGETFLRNLRIRVFDHLQSLSLDFFSREQTGRLVARMTSDIEALTELVQTGLVLFVTNGLLLVGTAVILVVISPSLSAVALVALPLMVVTSFRFRRLSSAAYTHYRDRIAITMATLQESLSGVRVVQAFRREEALQHRFDGHNRSQYDANMRATRISAFYFPVIEISGVITTAAVVGVGGYFVGVDTVSLGTIAAFVLYLGNVLDPVQQLSQLFNTVQSAGAALHKIYRLLDTVPSVQQRPGAVDLPAQGALVVRSVGFTYDGETPVLADVDLAIAPGERVAFVGPTGAGKSTLAKLVARLYDPTEGSVSFADVDLRDATLASLRRRIAVVPQEGYLFAGSIRDNVRLGRADATDADVEDALRAIGCYERFAALPEGLDTEVRERGSRLSAGERQIVSLARAALADPAVLVLDEATSNLDPGTEAEVEAAMNALMVGRTVIVIAHRLSTAARADRVVVVDEGRVVEVGPHADLVAAGGHYARLYGAWAGGHRPVSA